MLDLLLRNGQIVDGTGAARRAGAVAVRDGRVVAVGDVDEPAKRTIDVDGAIVSPGFVDVHTHYDAQVLWDPMLAPSTLHGVTSLVAGNCGFSVAPLTSEGSSYLMSMLARVEGMPLESLQSALSWDWESTADYLGRVEGAVAPNIGFMVGHSAIRRAVMGAAAKERESNPEELEAMKALLRASLAAGGMGFSSSLAQSHNDADGDPVPSRRASHDEVLELATVCREFPGTSLELVPFTGAEPFPEPVQQLMIELTVRAERPLNWNIINGMAAHADIVEQKLAVSDRAAAAGGKIVGLFMPMPIRLRLNFLSGFVLDMLPGWEKLMALPPAEKLELLGTESGRAHMRGLAESKPSHWTAWGTYRIFETFGPETKQYEGRTIADIAATQQKDAFDMLAEIAVADQLRTTFGFPPAGDSPADWEQRGRLLGDRRIVVGASDAGAHLDMIDTFGYTTHLLAECVRTHRLVPLEQAVHLVTQVPSQLYGLRDRGVIREGASADLVVFDEDTIGTTELETRADLPGGGRRLYAASTGIDQVIVNGETIVERGEHTGARPGRVLRSGHDSDTPSVRG
jgi:N-acyl-D-aspartate/D-glutamate deacylase